MPIQELSSSNKNSLKPHFDELFNTLKLRIDVTAEMLPFGCNQFPAKFGLSRARAVSVTGYISKKVLLDESVGLVHNLSSEYHLY